VALSARQPHDCAPGKRRQASLCIVTIARPFTLAEQQKLYRHNGKAWKVQPSPNPGSKSNALYGVFASSLRNAWAFGDYLNATTKPPSRNLALRFNGSSWGG